MCCIVLLARWPWISLPWLCSMLNKGFPSKPSPPRCVQGPGLLDPAPQVGLANTEHVLHSPPGVCQAQSWGRERPLPAHPLPEYHLKKGGLAVKAAGPRAGTSVKHCATSRRAWDQPLPCHRAYCSLLPRLFPNSRPSNQATPGIFSLRVCIGMAVPATARWVAEPAGSWLCRYSCVLAATQGVNMDHIPGIPP